MTVQLRGEIVGSLSLRRIKSRVQRRKVTLALMLQSSFRRTPSRISRIGVKLTIYSPLS